MKKKGSIFTLIKSLKPSEKRHFKLYASSLNVASNYLQLFDAIDNQPIYDENKIKQLFKGKTFIKQLHVTKNYLSKLILKSLRIYHHKISKSAEILDLLKDIEILFAKELFDQCFYAIKKAEKMSTRYEKFFLKGEVLQWKRKLLITTKGSNPEFLAPIIAEDGKNCDNTAQINKYWKVLIDSIPFIRPTESKTTITEKKLDKITGSPQSLAAQVLKHHILYSQGVMGNRTNIAENHLNKMIDAIEDQPLLIRDDPGTYINAINNKITFLILHRRYNEALPLLIQVREIPDLFEIKKSGSLRVKTLLRTYNVELEIYRDLKDLENGKKLISVISAFLEENAPSVSENYFILFWNQFSNIYFQDKNSSEALKWLNKIILIKSPSRPDIQRYARLVHLLIHFDLGNVIFLRYSIDSCRRFIKKQGSPTLFEKICLKHLAKLSHTPVGDYKQQMKKFHYELFIKHPDLVTPNILDYIDIRSWLDGKL